MGLLPARTVSAQEDLMQFYVVDKTTMEPVLFGSAAKSADLYAVCRELQNKGCQIYDAYLDRECTKEAVQEGSVTTVTEKTDFFFLVDAPNKRITYKAYRESGEEAASGYYKNKQGFYFTYDISKFETKLAESGLEFEGWYYSYDPQTRTFSNPVTDTNISVTDTDVEIYAKIADRASLILTAVLVKENGEILKTEQRVVEAGRPYNIKIGAENAGYELEGIYESMNGNTFSGKLSGTTITFTENKTLYYVMKETSAETPAPTPTKEPAVGPDKTPVPTATSTTVPEPDETPAGDKTPLPEAPSPTPEKTPVPSGTDVPSVPTPAGQETVQPPVQETPSPSPTPGMSTGKPPLETRIPGELPTPGTPKQHETSIYIGLVTSKITVPEGTTYNLQAKLDETAATYHLKILGVYKDADFTLRLENLSALPLYMYDVIYVKTQKISYTFAEEKDGIISEIGSSAYMTDMEAGMTLDRLKETVNGFIDDQTSKKDLEIGIYKDEDYTQPVDGAWLDQDSDIIPIHVKITRKSEQTEKKTYTLTFDINAPAGITASEPQVISVTEGTACNLPEIKCPGYIFKGWYDGEKLAESPYTPEKDVVFKAKWEKDESAKGPATYRISCDNEVQSYTVSQGGEIDITPYVEAKKKEGYLILGAYLDKDYEYKIEDLTKVDVSVISDIYIRVQYLRYNYNGSVTDMAYRMNKTVMENKALYEATFMNAGSYRFEYFLDKEMTVPFDSINATTNARPFIDIYVNTIITDPNVPQMYTISFEPQWPVERATKYSPQAVSGVNGTSIVLEDASCYGYVFLGWYLDSKYLTKAPNPFTLNGKSVRLYAKWEKEDPNKKWTVTFNANAGICGTPSKTVINGQAIGDLPDAAKDGYYFLGWYTDKTGGELVTKDTVVTSDMTIYARYSNREYSISYRLGSGINNRFNPSRYIQGQTVVLKPPTRGGYIFLGWFTDEKCTVANDTITQGTRGNLTFYAKWKKAKAPKAKITSVKNVKKKKIKVSIRKQNSVTGYQIKFSTSKKYNKGTIGTVTMEKNNYTIKKLKKGRKYYIKVRSYVKDSTGRKIYGKWSKSKIVKIKK